MNDIPIEFDCEAKRYKGHFTQSFGAASTNTYYLMIDNYYCGQLCMNMNGWAFYGTPKTKNFEEIGEYFGDYLTAWFE